jgi:hypothetical protein
MKSLRTLFLAIPLLTLVGCGCTSDEGGFTPLPGTVLPFRVGTRVTPNPVPPVAGRRRIDVFFLMDDSGFNPNAPGNPFNQPGMQFGDIVLQPGRKKQAVAQGIFSDMVFANVSNVALQKLSAALEAAYPNEDFDVAFGVGRYEDFGGPFRTDDQQARPFILNQPIFRENRDTFTTKFNTALTRNAPGSGNDRTGTVDPQTIVEALFQIAAGAGFDGNGGGTDGSGVFGSGQSQDAPGTSGDVPAASFTADGLDEDGEPQYTTPGGLLASGNLGGVGWRPEALHYVITTSDIAGVSPFPLNTPAGDIINISIPNSPGGTYPRAAAAVPAQAFSSRTPSGADGPTRVASQAAGRFGLLQPPVAPTDAHTLDQAIVALNVASLNIEVLSIGTPSSAPIPFKPNLPGGTFPDIPAIPDPANPDPSPFTWMSAFAKLTGATRPWPPAGPNPTVLPLVYNLATVFPQGGTVLPDLVEDLVYRVGEGLASLPAVGGPVLNTVTYEFALTLNTGPGSPFTIAAVSPVDTDGAGTVVTISGNNIRVQVQQFLQGQPPPATIEIFWIVQLQLNDPFRSTTASDNLPFTILGTAGLNPAKGPNTGTIFYTAPLPSAVAVGTATLANMTAGCAFVADQNGAGRTDVGTCP